MELSDLYFFLSIFIFEIVIELHHFSLPFPPSKYSHPFLSFQIYGLFFFDWYLYVYIYNYI